MPGPLAWCMAVTDLAFLAYWSLSLLSLGGWIILPRAWMFEGYDQPATVAWNWSFLPLDIGLSVLGLCAVALARRNRPAWRPLALLSLTFTMAAGGMAIAYWALLGQFDPAWFLPNLALLLWPMLFLPRLIADV